MPRLFAVLKTLLRCKPRTLLQLIAWSNERGKPTILTHRTSHGTFSGVRNDYLFEQAIKNGVNEPHFLDLITKILNPDDVALDLGANIGTHSILLSHQLSQGEVIAFEPQALSFSILQSNILANRSTNIKAYRFACSDKENDVVAMQPPDLIGESLNIGNTRVDTTGLAWDFVLTKTVDGLELDRLDFIKLDIQGSETKALKGAAETIRRFRPYLFVEIENLHLQALGSSATDLIELILSHGYALYRFETSYPCDHVCVPLENVAEFEATFSEKDGVPLSARIEGSRVELSYGKDNMNIYSFIKAAPDG